MGLLNKNDNSQNNVKQKTQKYSANQLSDDDLLNIAGGQDFHSEEEKQISLDKTLNILNKYK